MTKVLQIRRKTMQVAGLCLLAGICLLVDLLPGAGGDTANAFSPDSDLTNTTVRRVAVSAKTARTSDFESNRSDATTLGVDQQYNTTRARRRGNHRPDSVASKSVIADASRFCLPDELAAILSRAHDRGPFRSCRSVCLPRPQTMNAEDASYYEDEWDVRWCRSCVSINSYLPLGEILRIERAGNIRLCPRPETLVQLTREPKGEIIQSAAHGLRSAMRSIGPVMHRHDNIAVLIGNAAYGAGLPRKVTAHGDLAAFHSLLSEKLGYRARNIIEVRDAKQGDLVGLFGRRQSSRGILADRLKTRPNASLLIYFSGYGAIDDDDEEAYLLPVDTPRRYSSSNALLLQTLYENVVSIGAAHVTVILEVEFNRDPGAMILAPNPPLNNRFVLPDEPSENLSVMIAAQGDQHVLADPQYGSGLFTRYLIESLSGLADIAPLGNEDGVIDSAEAFVYAALKTRRAAAKSFGVMQRPGFSFERPVAITTLPVLDGKTKP